MADGAEGVMVQPAEKQGIDTKEPITLTEAGVDKDVIVVDLPGYPHNISACNLEMVPEPILVDKNFGNPITFNNPFRMLKVPLPDKILTVEPSATTKSLLELEYFANAQSVFYDSSLSCHKLDYFYFVAHNGIITRLVFNRLGSYVQEYNSVANPYPFGFHPGKLSENASRLPVSMQFAGDNYAFLSTGTGWLIIYQTDDRKSSNRWTSVAYIFLPKDCDTFVLYQETNGLEELTYGQPFHISDIQATSGKIMDIVLTCVTTHRAPDGLANPAVDLKRSTAHWLRLMVGDTHITRFGHHKIVDVNGRMLGVTIDSDHKGLIIASSTLPVIAYDSHSQVKDKGIKKIETRIPIPELYQWKDEEDTVTITFNYSGIICMDDMFVEFTENEITVTHRWERWLCGFLAHEIDSDASSWTFDRCLEKPPETTIEIVLKKKENKPWDVLVPTNKNGKKFVEPGKERKETDCSESDNLTVAWIESDFVLHAAHLKEGKFLMCTEATPNCPKRFAVSYNNDLVVYGFDSNPYPYKHEYTFEGFLPVYNSIENKKYVVYNHKDRSMVVVDGAGKIYVYYRRIPTTPMYQQVDLTANNAVNASVLRIVDYGSMDKVTELVSVIATERLVYLFSVDRVYVVAV